MNIEFDFITPFYLGAKDVFEQMFKTRVNISQISNVETNVTIDDITVDLEIRSSNFTGRVYYFMSKAFVTNILNIMMGFMSDLDLESEMTKSALLELNNMITGKALTKLAEMGTNYNMSVPEVVIGKGIKMSETNLSLSLVTLDSSGSFFTIGFLTSSVENLVKPLSKDNQKKDEKTYALDNKSLINQFKDITTNTISEIKDIKGEPDLLVKKGEIVANLAKNALKSRKVDGYDQSMDMLSEIKQLLSLTLDELKISKGDSEYIIRKNEVVTELAKVMLDVLLELVD
ncbi:hypothetical protein EON78_02100 [bacterium]|nr:MAG: hypothetical protein EON78_02100 [bacterium]